jgi:hypothetical protein
MTKENLTLVRLSLPIVTCVGRGRPQEAHRYLLHSATSDRIAEFTVAKIADPYFINKAPGFCVDPATWSERLVALEQNEVRLQPWKTSDRAKVLEFARADDYKLIRRHVEGKGIRQVSFTLELTAPAHLYKEAK